VLYIFGIILIYTAIKLLRQKEEDHADFNNSKVLRVAKKIFRFSDNHHQGKFFTIENRKLHGTVLLLIALLIETTDIIFAVDSIPAAFSITQNSFLIFTSNIFAVMGLRALFFLIEGVVDKFHHLQKGLSFILLFIGAKMLLVIVDVHISSIASFIVIMAALALSLIASLIFPKKI
jgi:tellurite resistance protein TerC